MDEIKVVNMFRFNSDSSAKSLHSATLERLVSDRIKAMEKLAVAYNFEEQNVTLHFFGDSKSDLQVRVECRDADTKARVTNALRLYQKNGSN